MIAYQVIESGKPLVCNKIQTPKPKGNEVLIKTISCGVCHSDVHFYDGGFDLGAGKMLELPLPVPYTLGHEIYGEVVETGELADVKVGKKFVIYPWIGCGGCEMCVRGDEHLCNSPQIIGLQVSGGFGDHVLVPHEKYLHDAGDTDPYLAGAFACSGLTAYSALKKGAPYLANNKVIIIGAGGVGMMALQIAKAAFNCNPIVIDIDDEKLNVALENGASATFNSKNENVMQEIIQHTGGGALNAIDFVGSELSVNFGINLLVKGGKYVIVGLHGGEFKFPLPLIPIMERDIQGSYVGSPGDMSELMALVRQNKIDPIPLQARDASEASKTLMDLKNGKILGRASLVHS